MRPIVLDRFVITEEVFRVLQGGGTIHLIGSHFDKEENRREPEHIALYDEADQFLDWLA